ncbi:MAG: NAD(P)H-hydrate dehydratase [Bacteroidetes bacterium]|jgi:NAD(P)H-hydrate epimerase|uniref:ADP-dependent (S)-NAD(P)H-hydrate dehydratase n=1 Tax=Candidatus Cryptobacteroides avicola TaxID=2840757 RepID=A0A940DSX5_9BACT|nr:NAD(P)H-hydrate dehydratase [Candidatus Cryptobacteroides avicola]
METDFSEIMERAAGNDYDIITGDTISGILKKREKDSHKGTYGHALLIAGSTGMTGAAVLAAGGALKSGCGLVTVHVPFQERHVIHISHPSAIVDCDPGTVFTKVPDNLHKYNAIGIGCGLGQSQDSISALKATFEAISGSATILDADALNIISSHPEMFPMIPRISVLTPHLGELSRLISGAAASGITGGAGQAGLTWKQDGFLWKSPAEMTSLTMDLASALGSIIIVKGYHTMICPPAGKLYFNTTGNPGMAKGGSGDILAGLLTGLCARGYTPLEASILAVWFHGKAGDDTAATMGMESMCASDILDHISIR